MGTEELIFGLIGGLGLLFIGMRFMSEGLQKAAGDRLRRILETLTNNRVVATFVGIAVTSIIQSSSATTVMTVSFVNAGLMTLKQAIGIVLGANIGTTVTAQIIAFKIHHYALPAIGLGVGLRLFARGSRWRSIGEVIMGFGMLFFGLAIMKDAMSPLKDSPVVREIFIKFDGNPFLGVLVGTIFTIMMQSSSVTVGVTMTLAASGLLSFYGSVALILGDNIGTTITAQLASIGTNTAARRTAQVHTLFNVIGVIYILLLFPYFLKFVDFLTPGSPDFLIKTGAQVKEFGMELGDKPYIARHIANAHTLFNVVNTLIFLPLLGVLAKISSWMIPQRREEEEFHLVYLNTKFVDSPPMAIEQARSETVRMGEISLAMVDGVMEAFFTNTIKGLEQVRKKEGVVDLLQREIISFLVRTSQSPLSAEDSREINSIIHMVNNIERVGDHAENLCNLVERKIRLKLPFTEMAADDIREIYSVSREFLVLVIKGIKERDRYIKPEADAYEERINYLEDTARGRHIERLNNGICGVDPGLVFIDMLTNFEKIGDHCFNIAEAVVGIK
ncbi:MAG: Na/Pi cotransporter family protein [Deltaproteobacteria bacterium]|nr:MAG: Na/Pi cotransporter family protein [Deltaproteobacteria bacterium]